MIDIHVTTQRLDDVILYPPTPHHMLVRLAEHQLAAALHNWRQITTGQSDDFVSYLELTPEQRQFLEKWAVPVATIAVYQGQ